jgi:hypothetical protein
MNWAEHVACTLRSDVPAGFWCNEMNGAVQRDDMDVNGTGILKLT